MSDLLWMLIDDEDEEQGQLSLFDLFDEEPDEWTEEDDLESLLW